MEAATRTIQVTLPLADAAFLRRLSGNMGWTIRQQRKSGLDLAIEDIKAGRIYRAKDGADLINQCLQ